MKKLFLALSALATLSMVAPSCGGGNKTPNNNTNTTVTVQELSVNPTSLSLYVGDKVTFGLSKTDVVVTLVPNTATYTIESDNSAVVKVDGKSATAVSEGSATLTLKAGDKTATVAVTVAQKASFDESKFKQDLYICDFDKEKMKNAKAEITAAMGTKEWEKSPFYTDDQNEQIAFQFRKAKTATEYLFWGVAYHYNDEGATSGTIMARAAFKLGVWKEQNAAKQLLDFYGFTSNFAEGEIQGKPAAEAYDTNMGLKMIVILEQTTDKSENILAAIFPKTPGTQSTTLPLCVLRELHAPIAR